MRGLGVVLIAALVAAGIAITGCGGDDGDDGGDQGSVAAKRWEGTFDSTFGRLTFTADGDRVTGDYEYCGGHLEGTAEGTRLTGEWTEDPQACAPGQTRGQETEQAGTFDFTLSADGASFSGNWRYASGARDPGGDDWEGRRLSSPTS